MVALVGAGAGLGWLAARAACAVLLGGWIGFYAGVWVMVRLVRNRLRAEAVPEPPDPLDYLTNTSVSAPGAPNNS